MDADMIAAGSGPCNRGAEGAREARPVSQEERSAAAKGMLLSGGQLKDLQRFSQGEASQEYAAAYGRRLGENTLRYGRDYQANADAYNRFLQQYQTRYNTLLGLRNPFYYNPYWGFFLQMIPHAFTIIVLVIGSREAMRKRIGAPAALGEPYIRGERGK